MSEWISVKDRLPLNDNEYCGIWVIAASEDGVKPLAYERAVVRGDTVSRWRWPGPSYQIYDGEPITHWMPLPKPPKGECDDGV